MPWGLQRIHVSTGRAPARAQGKRVQGQKASLEVFPGAQDWGGWVVVPLGREWTGTNWVLSDLKLQRRDADVGGGFQCQG